MGVTVPVCMITRPRQLNEQQPLVTPPVSGGTGHCPHDLSTRKGVLRLLQITKRHVHPSVQLNKYSGCIREPRAGARCLECSISNRVNSLATPFCTMEAQSLGIALKVTQLL